MNLAGVERVFELEAQIARMQRRMRTLERQAERIEQELAAELDEVRRSFRAELVPYEPPGKALVPTRGSAGRASASGSTGPAAEGSALDPPPESAAWIALATWSPR